MIRRSLEIRPRPSARCILVVDDDAELALLAGRVIRGVAPDLQVDVAATASQARAKLAAGAYEFVLLDHFLDEEERGIDLVSVVRAHQPGAGVAMMSSLELTEFVEVTSGEQGVQILPKPFSGEQLAAFMLDVLGSGHASARSSAERFAIS